MPYDTRGDSHTDMEEENRHRCQPMYKGLCPRIVYAPKCYMGPSPEAHVNGFEKKELFHGTPIATNIQGVVAGSGRVDLIMSWG
jgi:hypothetical protein